MLSSFKKRLSLSIFVALYSSLKNSTVLAKTEALDPEDYQAMKEWLGSLSDGEKREYHESKSEQFIE